MRLEAWLSKEGMTPAAFARKSGVGHRQLVHKYLRGIQFPSPENLLRIRRATNGEVTADDFVDQHAAGNDSIAPGGGLVNPSAPNRQAA